MDSFSPFMERLGSELFDNKLGKHYAMLEVGMKEKCVKYLVLSGIFLIAGLVFLKCDYGILKLCQLHVFVKEVPVRISRIFS